jgi:sec-independent protein translocase protein TatB
MIQGGEWIVIVLVALIVFGPERLPELSRKLGGWARDIKGAARELRSGLEAEVGDLRQVKADLTEPVKEVRASLKDAARLAAENNPSRLDWNGPKPVSGPTPAEALSDLEKIEAGEDPEQQLREAQ